MKTCYLIGIGMGNPALLTGEAAAAIAASGQIVGAQRMLEAFPDHPGERKALIWPEEIARAVADFPGDTAVLRGGQALRLPGRRGGQDAARRLVPLLLLRPAP